MARVALVVPGIKEQMVSIEKCSVIDNVYHGCEGSKLDFFYMYVCFFTDSHIRLSFDEFGCLACLECRVYLVAS